ncbi:MAG: sugar ABC transporter permease [Chloroflexi bacterium]|nr:sugar ABC transporter permease [Chloroflexota bacterium]
MADRALVGQGGRVGRPRINWIAYVLVAPALIMWAVFNVYTVVRGITMAFQDYRFLYPETQGLLNSFNGIDNFVEMLGDRKVGESLIVSLKYTALYLPASVILPVIIASLIARVTSERLASLFRVIVYMPAVLPIAAAMLVWRKLYDPQFGYLNVVISKLVGQRVKILWLGPQLALTSTAIAALWKGFGYNTLLFLIGIYGINAELYDAAAVDGCTGVRSWWYVTVPLLKPIFTLILVLNAGILGATEQMMVMTGGGPGDRTTTTGLYLWRVSFQYGDLRMGYAAAVALVLGLISMLMSYVVFKVMRSERA